MTSATTAWLVGKRRHAQDADKGAALSELVDVVGRGRIHAQERVAGGIDAQALAVTGSVLGDVEVADGVVPVAEDAVDRIDPVDLDLGPVADEQVAGGRVVHDPLGIGASERRHAEVADAVVGGPVDAVSPR